MRRPAARRPPPAAAAGRARGRRRHPEGRARPPPRPRGHGAVHRAHQRRRGRPRRLRRAGRRARARRDRPARRRPTPRRSTRSSRSCRPGPTSAPSTPRSSAAGAGNIGDYSHCSFATAGTGQFKPLAGAHPTIGEVGRLERVAETRLEMVLPRRTPGRGGGRAAGRAPVRGARVRRAGARPDPVARWASAGSARCPSRSRSRRSPRGSRPGSPPRRGACGRRAIPDRTVRRVAVCGGAGDSALDAALAAGVDAYVTADLRHHPAAEHLLRPGAPASGRRRALGVGMAVVRAGGGGTARRAGR